MLTRRLVRATSTITPNPVENLPPLASCTVTVLAAEVSHAHANDGPDHPAADHAFSFQVASEFGGEP